MNRLTVWLLLVGLLVCSLAIAWEQPDCAASMACRSTKTLPAYFESLM